VHDRNLFIFRNYTIEPLFKNFRHVQYSGYDDISYLPSEFSTYVWFYLPPVLITEDSLYDQIDTYLQKLKLVLSQCDSGKLFLILTLSSDLLSTHRTNRSKLFKALTTYNQALYELAETNPLIKIIDFDTFTRNYKNTEIIDWKYYFTSKILINPALANHFETWFISYWNSILSNRKKCIVLDLDNTLWGGILGEDGIEGIKLGETYPGITYKTFQKQLLEAVKNGTILAICSKNNESDVWEVFEKHPDMILRKDNFVSWRINWIDKASNIREIAEELNIGPESFVFIDDNPVERELIKTMVPLVTVPDFPLQPYKLKEFFDNVYESYFQIYNLTSEDELKTEQYKSNALRIQTSKQFENIEDYIKSLNINIKTYKADNFSIPRIAQLTQKTNQFNLTTRRYSETDILTFTNNGHFVYCASVSDKFGDNGLTIVAIFKSIDTISVEVDSYLLSCRILGKNIEAVFLKFLLNKLYDAGIQKVYATYIPSSKNVQTSEFFDKIGFSLISNNEEKKYYLEFSKKFEIPDYYCFE
jgi:FkbH-like protein